MEKSELVSVVIPTYNRKNVLPRAIDSVLSQTYENWELFIVDDGSTDGTEQMIRQKYGNDDRIHFLKRPDTRPKGANACRNIGIEMANGEYVAFLDSDDEWHDDHLRACTDFAKKQLDQFSGSYTGADVFTKENKKRIYSRDLKKGESHFDFLLSSSGFAPTPSFFLNRKKALNIKFDESLDRHQDWDFFIRFGEAYGWILNSHTEVIIHWQDEIKQVIDFNSCIEVYERNKESIADQSLQRDYLFSMLEKSIKYKAAKFVISYYKDEIGKIGYDYTLRNVLTMNFSGIFYLLYRLKRLLIK